MSISWLELINICRVTDLQQLKGPLSLTFHHDSFAELKLKAYFRGREHNSIEGIKRRCDWLLPKRDLYWSLRAVPGAKDKSMEKEVTSTGTWLQKDGGVDHLPLCHLYCLPPLLPGLLRSSVLSKCERAAGGKEGSNYNKPPRWWGTCFEQWVGSTWL